MVFSCASNRTVRATPHANSSDPTRHSTMPGRGMRNDLTISGSWTQMVVRGLESVGLDVRALCRACGLVYAKLMDPEVRLPRDQAGRLWREAAKRSDDPLLGLHAAARAPVGANNLLIHMVVSSRTLLEGLRRTLPYQRMLAHGRVVTLEERDDDVAMRLSRVEGDLPITRNEVEFLAVMLVRLGLFALNGAWRLRTVHFEHAPPRDADEYQRVFRSPVLFAQRENALVVPAAVMSLRLPHHCAETVRALETAAEARVRALAAPSIAGDVRGRVLMHLRATRTVADVDTIAAELHLSARTLQRRLTDERRRFSTVADEARRDLAVELLDGEATLERIAAAVGFADTSVLVRAFKRWTGKTPTDYRSRQVRSAS
jgi:AraC-like DNA-binding protein